MASNDNVKRKTSLSIEQKTEIFQKLNSGVTVSQLADEYNIHPTTVRRIRGIGMTVSYLADQGVQMRKRKKLRKPANVDLEKRLYVWFLERRAMGDVITDSLLQKKALEFSKEFKRSSEFKASLGWLSRFKERHDIRLMYPGKKGCTNIVAYKNIAPDFEFLNCGNVRSNCTENETAGERIPEKVKEEPTEDEEERNETRYREEEANRVSYEEEESSEEQYKEVGGREDYDEADSSQREIEQALEVLEKHTEEAPFFIKSTLEVLRDFLLERKT